MAQRDEIVAFADRELDAMAYADMLPTGLQVAGARDVSTIATGVTASLELFRRACELPAEMILVHHGLFWRGESRRIGPREKERLRLLFDGDLSLVAYHLPLDGHPRIGNNAILCELLGLERLEPFAEHGGRAIGWIGHPPAEPSLDDITAVLRERVKPDPLVFAYGPERIRRVAVVSGGAAADLLPAADLGADCFITGEAKEAVMEQAREAGVHFIAAGHYATEVFGVRALGDAIAERFGVEHRFIDVPNPV
jgi:dinuclear metal center YbgI/SA1388 family protein